MTFSSNPTSGKDTFYVWNDTSSEWELFDAFEYFNVKKRQNQMSEFEIKIFDISTSQKAYFKEGSDVLFFSGTNLILKGRIQTIEYASAYEVVARGNGKEVLLLDREFIKNGDNRIQYTNESAQTIANDIIGSIMNKASDGIFSSDYGEISMRFEYANRLNSLGKLAESIDYEWWVSQSSGDDYVEDTIHLAPYQGETTSQKTFDIGDNVILTSQERDLSNLVNYIHVLGYGDGVNQLKTSNYCASTTSSFLSADISSTATTISLDDTSDFPSSGTIRIAEEQITYTGISGNDLTGCSRGANSTTAKAHKKGIYVEKYVDYTSPETDSSIEKYGLKEYSIVDRSLINEETAELMASKYLIDRKEPIIRIKVVPDEIESNLSLGIGDLVTLTDSEADISGDYRIVGIDFTSEYGTPKLEFELSNFSLEFIEQLNKAKKEQENLSKYMQGSTNIYAISEAENCDNSHSLNMRFYIPTDAITINKVHLNFKMKPYRAYSSTTESESSHTHGIPSLSVNSHSHSIPSLVVNGTSTQSTTSGSKTPSSAGGVSVWNTNTVNYSDDGNLYAIAHASKTVVGSPTFYTTRVKIYLNNQSGSTQSVTPKTSLPSGTTITHATNYSLSNGYMNVWESGESSTSNESGIFDFWDDNFNATSCWGTVMNVYYHTHGSHSHSIPSTSVNGTTTQSNTTASNGSTTASNTTASGSAHTHGINYQISENSLSSQSVEVKVGEDGGTLTSVGTYTTDQTDLDITDYVTNVGAGKWIDIEFTPNQNMRIEANAYIKLFIESK